MSITATRKRKPKQKMYAWEKPVDWDEKFKWARSITFDGKQFNQWVRDVLPMTKGMKLAEHTDRDRHIKVGDNYVFYLRPFDMVVVQDVGRFIPRIMETRHSLAIYKGTTEGRCMFSTKVGIPILASKGNDPWMSLTPNEILTQRGQVRRAKGNVGVAGLGLGWAVRRMLERKQVDRLTVVEKCEAVADAFGAPLKQEFGDKLAITVGDAYGHDWMQHDVALWDIWRGYGDAYWDDEFQRIRRNMAKAGKFCFGWGQGIQGV